MGESVNQDFTFHLLRFTDHYSRFTGCRDFKLQVTRGGKIQIDNTLIE